MNTTLHLIWKHIIQVGVMLGSGAFVYLASFLLANALAQSLSGYQPYHGSVSAGTPATGITEAATRSDVSPTTTDDLLAAAAAGGKQALIAMRRQVRKELESRIRNPLPSVAVGRDAHPGRDQEQGIEYLRLVADANGHATLYTTREIVYEELKRNMAASLDPEPPTLTAGASGNVADYHSVAEDPSVTADRNAELALAATRQEVIRELDENFHSMISALQPGTSEIQVARNDQPESGPAAGRDGGTAVAWIRLNSRVPR